jgi:hypothetical protein
MCLPHNKHFLRIPNIMCIRGAIHITSQVIYIRFQPLEGSWLLILLCVPHMSLLSCHEVLVSHVPHLLSFCFIVWKHLWADISLSIP